jgi:PAS domain S-box-containing protein
LNAGRVTLNASDADPEGVSSRVEEGDPYFFRLIFDATPEALVVLNQDGIVLHASEVASSLLGSTCRDVVGHRLDDFIASHHKSSFASKMSRFLEGVEVAPFDTYLSVLGMHEEASTLPIEVSARVLINNNRTYVIAALRDQVRSKRIDCERIECKLLSMDRRHSLAMSASSIGIWDWDVEKNVLLWEDDTFRLFGIQEPDTKLAHEIWKSALHPDDATRVKEPFSSL